MGRIYRSSKSVVYFNIAAPLLFAVFVAFAIYDVFVNAGPNGSPTPLELALVSALSLGILVLFGYRLLRAASQIHVKDDSVVEFRGPLVGVSLNPLDITSVRATPWMTQTWADVRHTTGRVRFFLPVDGLYEFLAWLKHKNPNVEIKWL